MNVLCEKFGLSLLRACALLTGTVLGLVNAQNALSQSLQGQSKGDTVNWLDGNVSGWQELEYIPMRVYFPAGSVGSHSVTIVFPHLSGKVFGFQELIHFRAFTANIGFTTFPTLVTDASGNWSYVFTADISDNNPAEVRFFARLASGAHLYGGSSLQLKGSAGNVQFHKPLAAAGAPNLAVSQTGPATAPCGSPLTYTLSYTNKALGYTAAGAQLSLILDPQLTLIPYSLQTSAHIVGNTIFWDLGDLPAEGGGEITFQASVNPSTHIGMVLTNVAQVYSSENDLDVQDNSASVLTTVVCGGTGASILSSPASVTVCPGESASFSAAATGSSELTYQWRKDGVPVNGATDANLMIAAVSSSDVGSYDVLVSSPCDTVASAAALLSLQPGLPLNLTPGQFEPDGAFVLHFGTSCGGTYFVEYSEDLVTWKTSPQTVPGNGLAVQWRDAGPPVTESTPSSRVARFYRVVRVF